MKFSDATTPDAKGIVLGDRLGDLRRELNLTQAAAAARAGLERKAVQRAEQGRGTVDSLLRLLTAYGVADRLELVLPEPEIGPEAQLAAERLTPQRQRVRSGQPTATRIQWGGDQ